MLISLFCNYDFVIKDWFKEALESDFFMNTKIYLLGNYDQEYSNNVLQKVIRIPALENILYPYDRTNKRQ